MRMDGKDLTNLLRGCLVIVSFPLWIPIVFIMALMAIVIAIGEFVFEEILQKF